MILSATEYTGRVIITWPQQSTVGDLFPPLVMLHDADSGEWITSVLRFAVESDAAGREITAELAMLVDADGKHLLSGAEATLDDDGEIRSAVFRWLVAEMRVAEVAA